MRQFFKVAGNFWKQLPSIHRKIIAITSVFVAFLFVLGGFNSKQQDLELTIAPLPPISEKPLTEIETQKAANVEDYFYTIDTGDTLSQIFNKVRLPQADMYSVLESDLAVLALDTLKPGNHLRFWVDRQNNTLEKLELEFSPAHKVTYARIGDKGFEYNEEILPGVWEQEIVAGEVNGSFYQSARKVGMNANEIMSISSLFKDRMNFNKGFRRGDTFEIIRSRQSVNGVETGDSKIEAIRLNNRSRELTAFLYKDSYYDKDGNGMERAFSRTPLHVNARISSKFNPKRRHPVTGLIRPHNGTDFAVGIGTPVYATGDGIVTEVVKHAYAGLYIKIKHGQKYQTRYLHLSKALVRKGQAITRGQKIALSGNSGRSTGAHLHYELLVNNRAVNAMGDDVPIMTEIDGGERIAFNKLVKDQLNSMSQTKLAMLSGAQASTEQ
jgi:murein DD-endopeptidase